MFYLVFVFQILKHWNNYLVIKMLSGTHANPPSVLLHASSGHGQWPPAPQRGVWGLSSGTWCWRTSPCRCQHRSQPQSLLGKIDHGSDMVNWKPSTVALQHQIKQEKSMQTCYQLFSKLHLPTKPSGPTSFKAILSARMEELPWAMLANGPAWTNTGFPCRFRWLTCDTIPITQGNVIPLACRKVWIIKIQTDILNQQQPNGMQIARFVYWFIERPLQI